MVKKNCYDCHALTDRQPNFRCALGYPIDNGPELTSPPIPKIECPKPKTIKAYVNLIEMNQYWKGGHP